MTRRVSSLGNALVGIERNIGSEYDTVKLVADNMASVLLAAEIVTDHLHTNKAILDATEESFTTALKTKLDSIETGANNVQNASSVLYTNTFSGLTATTLQAAIDELDAVLDGIEPNATADQSSAEVPYTNTTSGLAATNVQAALDEIDATVDSLSTDSHTHSNIAVLDATQESFTTVLKNKLDGIEANATADQSSSEVSYDNAVSGLTATNVKTAIDELAAAPPTLDINGLTGESVVAGTDTFPFYDVDGVGNRKITRDELQRALFRVQVRTAVAGFQLALTDIGWYIRCSHATGFNITVPANATVAFDIGDSIAFEVVGDGAISFLPAAGVTINNPTTGTQITNPTTIPSTGKYKTISLVKVATDEWTITGGI